MHSYFYFAAYSLEGKIDYSKLPKLENERLEISEYWKGAVLPLSELGGVDKNVTDKVATNFLQISIQWLSKL